MDPSGGKWHTRSGAEGAKYFLALHNLPTAIVCFNDMMAIGCLHQIQQSGLNVPRDISITGFDNIQFSEYTNPPLTTFDQPKREIGAAAARMLLDLLHCPEVESNSQPKIIMLQGHLLTRGTTAPRKNT